MSEFERVASVSDIPSGGRLSIIVDDLPSLLIRQGDAFYAIEDVCFARRPTFDEWTNRELFNHLPASWCKVRSENRKAIVHAGD